MTTVRLAYGGSIGPVVKSLAKEGEAPAGLVSYFYLHNFIPFKKSIHFRDWVLDSGAFSANAIGAKIDLKAYGETCLELLASDPTLVEVFSLDVIGDQAKTMRNTEELWNMGVPAIPTFHVGGRNEELKAIAKDYDKIALGGAVGFKQKLAWSRACFREVWPCKIHGFGFGARKDILALPWHSVDSTNWEVGPQCFGSWSGLASRQIGDMAGKPKPMSVRTVKGKSLRCEVDYYLRVEREAKWKWREEMALLDEMETKR